MRRGIRKPLGLKVMDYTAHMINTNKSLSAFPGRKESYKISEMELNENVLNIMPNEWSNQAYVQGFHYAYITF